MEFNLAFRGRVGDVKDALKDQAKAISKSGDQETAACVGAVAKALIEHIDGEDQDRAVGVFPASKHSSCRNPHTPAVKRRTITQPRGRS